MPESMSPYRPWLVVSEIGARFMSFFVLPNLEDVLPDQLAILGFLWSYDRVGVKVLEGLHGVDWVGGLVN